MSLHLKVKFFLTLAAGGVTCAAMAAPVNILNASFESPDVPLFNTGPITDWTQSAGGVSGVYEPGAQPSSGAGFIAGVHGFQTAFINSGNILQTLTSTLNIGSYVLSINVGDRADLFAPQYMVELLGGSTVLGSITHANFAPSDNNWVTAQLNFTALSGNALLGQNLGIRLSSTMAGRQTNFDNVRLDFTAPDVGTNIPEPGTLALVGLAAIALGTTRRRRFEQPH